MKYLILTVFAIGVLCGTRAQTAIGSFEHVANSAAAQTKDGVLNPDALLKGRWMLEDVVDAQGKEDTITRICTGILQKAGFDIGSTLIVFGDGGAFGIVCNRNTLPGTWSVKENHDTVRLNFSKIFTYGMTAQILPCNDGYLLLFSVERFIGLMQRIAVILGRQDTSALMKSMQCGMFHGTKIGFRITENKIELI